MDIDLDCWFTELDLLVVIFDGELAKFCFS